MQMTVWQCLNFCLSTGKVPLAPARGGYSCRTGWRGEGSIAFWKWCLNLKELIELLGMSSLGIYPPKNHSVNMKMCTGHPLCQSWLEQSFVKLKISIVKEHGLNKLRLIYGVEFHSVVKNNVDLGDRSWRIWAFVLCGSLFWVLSVLTFLIVSTPRTVDSVFTVHLLRRGTEKWLTCTRWHSCGEVRAGIFTRQQGCQGHWLGAEPPRTIKYLVRKEQAAGRLHFGPKVMCIVHMRVSIVVI
jgi:hypothetical protein